MIYVFCGQQIRYKLETGTFRVRTISGNQSMAVVNCFVMDSRLINISVNLSINNYLYSSHTSKACCLLK